jgi:hypothetical protein
MSSFSESSAEFDVLIPPKLLVEIADFIKDLAPITPERDRIDKRVGSQRAKGSSTHSER